MGAAKIPHTGPNELRAQTANCLSVTDVGRMLAVLTTWVLLQPFFCQSSALWLRCQAVGEHNYAAWSVRVMAGKFQYARNNLVAFSALIADMKAIRQVFRVLGCLNLILGL